MSFFATHILEISSSQIKIKCVGSFVGMLIALKHYHLQVKAMNQIIIVHMNWLDDLGFNCKLNSNFNFFLKGEVFFGGRNMTRLKKLLFLSNCTFDGDQLYEIKMGLCEVWLGQGTCVAVGQNFKKLKFTNSLQITLF
jgi:hypothetical protein